MGCWHGCLSGVRCRLAYGPLSLASVKSRLVLPFWYRLTRVVPDKGLLNGCVCVCVHICCLSAVSSRNLTWRDVQNIVVETSRIPNAEEDGWTVNGGGYHVNHRFGFGALDCGRMVEAAQGWIGVQEQHTCTVSPEHSQV